MKKKRPPVIALITDFGTRDYFVGAMKGVILSINSRVQIADVTHEVEPQNLAAAGFTLRACYRNFPEKTIFVAVVDPGVGSQRRAILVETENYYFIAPDNGLLSFVFAEAEAFRVFQLVNEKYFAREVSATFHGRDIFAPVAAHLSRGVKPESFGGEIKDFVRADFPRPEKISAEETKAAIVHIDRFGNLVTNLKREDLPAKFALETGGRRIEKLRNFYSEAEPGEIIMLFGSAGFLEIAACLDSAEKLLSAAAGQEVFVKKS